MRYIVLILTLSIFSNLRAEDSNYKTLEFSSSFLTHHYSYLNADRFANQVSADGRTINNPLYGMTYTWSEKRETYGSFSVFGGEDSIGSPMHGIMTSAGFGDIHSSGVQFGAVWGLYFYDEDAWEELFYDREAKTPSWLYAYYGDQFRGVNMIFGIELNLKLDITDSVFIKFRNTFTPMISNHSVGLGFEF